jgi:hypothetical protein
MARTPQVIDYAKFHEIPHESHTSVADRSLEWNAEIQSHDLGSVRPRRLFRRTELRVD